ncbi:hypothetical protein COT68_02990 [bacterium (Candidatus Torokbacteria) CG09_land_8_20_14_0_10_42_11]|nr:MAG: hypothetical protein COT68_02990 [bacterium (Candidatus Torokbacteria) CG09_land_8_20_14_0_10_42_11]
MDNPNPENKLDQILEYSQKAAMAAEKTRKYMLWSIIIQVGMVVLPLIGLLIAIPFMLKNLTSAYQGLL